MNNGNDGLAELMSQAAADSGAVADETKLMLSRVLHIHATGHDIHGHDDFATDTLATAAKDLFSGEAPDESIRMLQQKPVASSFARVFYAEATGEEMPTEPRTLDDETADLVEELAQS